MRGANFGIIASSILDFPPALMRLSTTVDSSLTRAYQNLTGTITGTSGTKTLVFNNDQTFSVLANMSLKAKGVDIYTVASVSTTTGITTVTTNETLVQNYAADTCAILKVAPWTDLTPNGNNAAQVTPANQVGYVPNALNGQPLLNFNRNDADYFVLPTAVQNAITRTTAHTIFSVFKSSNTADAGGNMIISASKGGAGSDLLAISIKSNVLCVGYYNGSTYNAASTAFTDTATAHILTISHAADAMPACKLDGVAMSGSTTPFANTGDGGTLGIATTGSFPFGGSMAELEVYNSVLSSTQISQKTTELAQTFNISI